jgi:beta-N-acetylhexosaminidase
MSPALDLGRTAGSGDVGTDQESGVVQRITSLPGRPAEEDAGAWSARHLTCSNYQLGQQLLALGINQDYAPVGDVIRTTGGVIGNRSFGPDPKVDARDVDAAVTGLQDAGVLATLKHWPGHGSTNTDSHTALPVVSESLQVWGASTDSRSEQQLRLPRL